VADSVKVPERDVTTLEDAVDVSRAESKRSPGARLWRDRNFNTFWAGQTFDALGDSLVMIAIPLLVLEATGSVAQMGLVTATIGVGNLISGVTFGSVVDRMDRRKLLVGCDILRALFYAFIPLIWWLGGPATWLIYTVAGLTAYLTTAFMVTYTSVIPAVVDNDQIVEANGRLQMTVAVAYVAGPMIAGFTSKYFGPTWTITIIILIYVISATLMSWVRFRKAAPVEQLGESDAQHPRLTEFFAGARFLLTHPVLKSVTLLRAAFTFLSECVVDLSIFYLKHDLSKDDKAVGVIFGVASIGAIAGGALASTLRNRFGFGLCFLISLILQGVAITSIGFAPIVALIVVLATLFSFGNTIMRVSTISLRQQLTPDPLLGRVSSAYWTFFSVTGAIGVAIATAVAQRVGASITLIALGILGVLIAAVGFFTAANTAKPEEALDAPTDVKN
jgi:MFS family permease